MLITQADSRQLGCGLGNAHQPEDCIAQQEMPQSCPAWPELELKHSGQLAPLKTQNYPAVGPTNLLA